MSKKIGMIIVLLLSCGLCLAGCGKEEEAPASQPVEQVAEGSPQQETKIEGLDEYLTLAAQVDALLQKKEMLYSLRNNSGVLMMPTEEKAELLTVQERIGKSRKPDSEPSEEQALEINNMRSFWNVYDSLVGDVSVETAPTDGMDQVLQDLSAQKDMLEKEVAAMEAEYRTPLEYGFDHLDDGQWEEKLPGLSKLKVERLDAAEGWTVFYLKVIETTYPGLSAGDYIYIGGDEWDPCEDNFKPLLFGNYVDDKLTFEAVIDKHNCGSEYYRIVEFIK